MDVTLLAVEEGGPVMGLEAPRILCRSLYRRYRRIQDPAGISLTNQTRTSALLDYESKMGAVALICESIPSLDGGYVKALILGAVKGAKVHTWGVTTPGSGQRLLSTIVFRKHYRLEIVELLYIATDTTHRATGFGRYLLEDLVSNWKDEGYSYVLTHADFSAAGFFERLSFNMSTPFPRELFDTWVDRYSSSILMCRSLSEPVGFDGDRSDCKRIKILIASENTDKSPIETWVTGRLMYEREAFVLVQYSYHQRLYSELLRICSKRLHEI